MLPIKQISKKIRMEEKILLLTHENPDGDAIGSMMALFISLSQQLAKKVTAVCPSAIPRTFSFLPAVEQIQKDFLLGDHGLIIILDCGDLRRTGFAHRLKEFSQHKQKVINIDHHPRNDIHKIAKINFVDYQASSTAELIYHLLKELDITIDQDIATSLLCGLYTDTGAFKHSNTSPQVLRLAANLLSCGGRLKLITNHITNGKSTTALKLWGLALSRIRFHRQLGLVSSIITQADMKKCQAEAQDLAGVVNLINTIPEGKAAILLAETEPGKIKASLRTEKNYIDVSRLAALFGGGGLKKASGFSLDGRIVADDKGGWQVILN